MSQEREELLKRVREIKNSFLIVGGAKDLKSPPECQKYSKRLLPHANLVILPNTGHMSIIENAEVFNCVVIDFLKNIG